jgi:hypothetical protein
MRRTGIQPMSGKRRAALAAAGQRFPSSTFASPVTTPSKPRARPVQTGPDQAAVTAVLERDGHQCVRCGGACWGERGRDWSVQHRKARGSGGTSRPDANAPQVLILLCGSATTACHGWVESNRAEAEANGWAVKSNEDPLTKPVLHSLHGWVFLTASGSWTTRRPAATEVGP